MSMGKTLSRLLKAIYQETIRQFVELEAEHLSDLTYYPVIL